MNKTLAMLTVLTVFGLTISFVLRLTDGRWSRDDDRRREDILATLEGSAPQLDEPTRREVAAALVEAENRHGIDALLLLSVIDKESRFDPDARGPQGALGLMQVRPATGSDTAESLGLGRIGPAKLLEPRWNVRIGSAYLAHLYDRFQRWDHALMAYNAGPARLKRWLADGAVRPSRYAEDVLARWDDRVRAESGTESSEEKSGQGAAR